MDLLIGLGVGILVGVGIAILIGKLTSSKVLGAARAEAQQLLEEARAEAEQLKREKMVEADEEIFERRQRLEQEIETRTARLQKFQEELDRRELDIDRKAQVVEKKDRELQQKEKQLQEKQAYVDRKAAELNAALSEQLARLEEIAGMTREEAKAQLIRELEQQAREEGERIAQNIVEQARLEANRRAREIVVQAIQQVAAEQSVEATVTVVPLPSEEMKGRIIGREGRNIRAFEMATGVDVIIDDTPEIVVLSSYNSYRREIARRALEKLISDGRIHPARIEEVVAKTREEMQETLRDIGEQAILEVGIHGVAPELLELLGKLKYRTSYGQNVLNHSIEVAYLCGIMAAELGLDVHLAKRAGLFHDIGKALENYSETSHAERGAELLRKLNEHPAVINAALAHHNEREATTPYTSLVAAADVISGSRPGARRESLQNFIRRMEQLETIATQFQGVEKAYAIQAGREVRVVVETEQVDDQKARELARGIARKIQEEMEFPGQVKVTVIREYRAYDFAT
ncbi:MAG: ribonuclease Y [Calditrichaeota bacterium]|nr:MAG: ribonuclease Y [Calditrichota bacterium]